MFRAHRPKSPSVIPPRRPRSPLQFTGTFALLLSALLLPACTPTPQPTPSGITHIKAKPPKPDLSRPIAAPAQPLARTTSRLTVAIRPLGSVPFDGITLPLTSPSGRFIAAQHGPIPGWDALLAAPTPAGTTVPVQLRLSAYEVLPVEQTPRDGNPLREVRWPSPPPQRLLIGRSSDDVGFLVEYPRPETGSRWIGKLAWESGEVEWLVAPTEPDARDTAVACFGTLGPSGELAFCRAEAPGKPFDLIIRPDASASDIEHILHPPAGSTFAMPTYAADSSRVFVYLVSATPGARLAVLAIDVPADSDGTLIIAARVEFNAPPSIDAAYHGVAPLQTPWPLAAGSGGGDGELPHASVGLPAGCAFVSSDTGSMCWFDGQGATAIPLARATLGAAPLFVADERGTLQFNGLLLGAAGELVYQPVTLASQSIELGADVAVLKGAFLPHITTTRRAGSPTYLLLSPPMPSDPPRVGCCEMTPVSTP